MQTIQIIVRDPCQSFKYLKKLNNVLLLKLCYLRFPKPIVRFSLLTLVNRSIHPDGEGNYHIQQTEQIFQEGFMFMKISTHSVPKCAFLSDLLCLSSDQVHKPAHGLSKNCLFCIHDSYCWVHQVAGSSKLNIKTGVSCRSGWRVLSRNGL